MNVRKDLNRIWYIWLLLFVLIEKTRITASTLIFHLICSKATSKSFAHLQDGGHWNVLLRCVSFMSFNAALKNCIFHQQRELHHYFFSYFIPFHFFKLYLRQNDEEIWRAAFCKIKRNYHWHKKIIYKTW